VQYCFTKGNRDLKAKPHGNSKSGKVFYPTQKSTKEEIKKLAQSSKPRDVFHKTIEEKGGVRQLSFPGENARNYQQVADFRQRVGGQSKRNKPPDTLIELMQMCKRENRDPGTAFV